MVFDYTLQAKRIVGDLISNLTVTSATKCALACNRNKLCRSLNFCATETRNCQLNKEDVFSTEEGDNILQDDVNCIYYGMNRTSKPLCAANGIIHDIQNGTESSFCGRYQNKRVDAEFGNWVEFTEIDNSSDLKVGKCLKV